jgi:hypothetical protein
VPLRNVRSIVLFSLFSQVGLAASGCDDLHEFETTRGTVFRGEVVGSDSAPEQSSFIRTGFSSHTRMELEFDPEATGVDAESDENREEGAPGRVHTFTCPSNQSDCKADDGTTGPFDHARLEPIENLTHDALSEYTFPGFGRLKNYIFNVRFETAPEDGATIARNATLFLSLMDTGKVEVRAISPSVLTADGQTDRLPALFGVFILGRQSR